MTKTVFLAGASGAIGRHLVPLLVAEGWRVVGSTRSKEKAALLEEAGVEPRIVDVFDAPALSGALRNANASVVIHQLTDLPPGLDPSRMAEAAIRNARIREVGTRNLVDAAVKAGVTRFIAQSVAFAYAEKKLPYHEDDPLAIASEGRAGVSARGVASLEQQVIAAPLIGIVLRYGRLYGPGTGFGVPGGPAPLHVDAAAKAAAQAVLLGSSGIYNIAEDDGTVDSEKAKRDLAWSAHWRNSEGQRQAGAPELASHSGDS
jgi:nucleoside-diphosphate-sugar epimerase